MFTEFPELLELQHFYHVAEQRIKTAEILNDELSIPSINELRYAGRHLVDAIVKVSSDSEQYFKLVEESLVHCKRAIYDASEVSISYLYKELEAYNKHFRNVEIQDIIPNYADHLKNIKAAKKFVEENHHRKEEDFQLAETHVEKLKEIKEIFDKYEPLAQKRNRLQAFKLLGYLIALSISILGVILALI